MIEKPKDDVLYFLSKSSFKIIKLHWICSVCVSSFRDVLCGFLFCANVTVKPKFGDLQGEVTSFTLYHQNKYLDCRWGFWGPFKKKKLQPMCVWSFFYHLPPWRVSEEATLSWRTAQTWAMWRTAPPVGPTWCVWSDAASQWRPSTSAAAQGRTSDTSVQTTGWESRDTEELNFTLWTGFFFGYFFPNAAVWD